MASVEAQDDLATVCAISILAGILANVLHEGLGHAATALLTGAKSGVLSTVAWSSDFDSRLVAAGGTLANLAAGAAFWLALRSMKSVSVQVRFFLLTALAFNLFDGTGYFFFSGVTDFGDWAAVIAGLPAHWLWRALLVAVGVASYFWAVLVVGKRAGTVRRSSEERAAPVAETHVPSLCHFGCPCERKWPPESPGSPIALAIRLTRHGGRALRASLADVLHSERGCSRAAHRWHREELPLDFRGFGSGRGFHFWVRPRHYAQPLVRAQ